MATPKLLLSRLLRRRPSILTIISVSSSSSSIFFSQSRNLTTQNRILPVSTSIVHSLPPGYHLWCSRFISTHDSDYGEGPSLDSGTDPLGLGVGAFGVDDDICALQAAQKVVTAASADGGDVGREMFLPVRVLISLLDSYHDFTGFPWWVIIASSTLALRITLLPVLLLQLNRLKKIAELLPKLPPPFPPPLSGRSYIDQFSLFRKEKRAVGCPSLLWFLAYTSFQVPCYILWMTSTRRMSLDHHPGFDCGGILWFQNLTESPHGLLGFIFPLLIASLHYVNVQISFQKSSTGKTTGLLSLLVRYYKKYLEVLSVPILFTGFVIPQGSLVYWLTNSSLTLIQQLSLNHPVIRQKLGLPDRATANGEGKVTLKAAVNTANNEETDLLETAGSTANSEELGALNKTQEDLPRKQRPILQLSPQELLALSVKYLADDHMDRAIPLLRLALDKDPEYVNALIVMGRALLQNGQLAEASEYFECAICKLFLIDRPMEVEEIDLLINASQWAGLACIHQGKSTEGIRHLERVTDLKEPEAAKSKALYYDTFVLLASALYNEGRKAEAVKCLRKAVVYDSAYNGYLEQCEKDDDFVNDLVSSRRGDY